MSLVYDEPRFRQVLGTGGIGMGMVFELLGNDTLGRTESRMANLTPKRDFCKLHIIMHYMAALLGENALVLPIGKVGDDPGGRELLRCMREAGMDTRHVSVAPRPTMNATCFIYPNGDTGNITAANSACELVDGAYVERAVRGVEKRDEIFLAAPEVPMDARVALLKLGRDRGAFCAASFASGEAEGFMEYLRYVDLLALNLEEARAMASMPTEDVVNVIERSSALLRASNPEAKLIVTCGPDGVYACDERIVHVPAPDAPVVSTAGAGDALLGGTLAALAAGLPLLPDEAPFASVSSAIELGVLTAVFAIQRPDTIAFDFSAGALYDFALQVGALSDRVKALFSRG